MTRFSYTIVFVRDMGRSVKFYRDALGLPLRFESPEWSEFATGSCNLALHKAAEGTAQPASVNRNPAGHCHVGFTVNDLDEFHHRIVGQGTQCLQEPKTESFGRVAVYADPDGLPVEVAQLAVTGAATP
jgi:lactoylglutathione lyase